MGAIDQMTLIGIILMIAGFVLVGIEMVLPGFSFPGIGGIACLIISVFLTSRTVEQGIIFTIIIIIILAVMLGIILRLLSKGKLSKSIVLTEMQNKEKGYTSAKDLKGQLGKKGVAHTDLRPSGVGDFDGINLDVITEGEYILRGTPIMIKDVQASKLIVKAVEREQEE